MGRKPSFKFSLSFPGKIWQTALDEVNGIWALEVRQPDSPTVTYHLLNLRTNEHEEVPQITETDLWTVILRLFFPVMVLERYNDPQDPTDKDLVLYDIAKRKKLTILHQFQFKELVGQTIRGHLPADRDKTKTFSLPAHGINLNRTKKAAVGYPVYFPPASENMKIVSEFLRSEPSGLGCEYYESESHIIISYYVRLDRKFERSLLVLAGDDELYHEVQDSGLTGYASGAFFVFENLLVFVKNGNQIHGIEL